MINQKLTRIIPISRTPAPVNDALLVLKDNQWDGRRCLIVGGGPSLSDFDPKLIESELTIGINKAFLKYNCTINYSMDYRFYDELRKELNTMLHNEWLKYKGIKLFLRQPDKNYGNDVYTIKNAGKIIISLAFADGIYGGTNSGIGAIMLAIVLGVKKIGLLGYDMNVDTTAGKTHWHNGYGREIASMKETLDGFIDCFNGVAPLISQAGINVFNLNPNSALDCFPKIKFQEFLKDE